MTAKQTQAIRERGWFAAALSIPLLTSAVPALADDTQIVAGKRVGAISIGEARATVEKTLGKAQTEHAPSPQRTLAMWPLAGKGNLHVEFIDGKVARVGTNAKEYATSDALAVGATLADVRAKHAALVETDYAVQRKGGRAGKGALTVQCYDDVANGIGFAFGAGDGKSDFVLTSIYVHAPGKAAPCGQEDDPRATKKIGATK